LTETRYDEKVVVSAENQPSTEKIVERKTIVYETRIDPTVIKLAGEKIKDQLYTRLGFLKPKPEEVEFVSIDKYYEPYIMVSGTYCLDFYRRCLYSVNIDKQVLEVILLNHELKPEQTMQSSAKDHNVIRLEGEERIVNNAKDTLLLDRFGQDVSLERLPSAPSEKNPKKILAECNAEEIPENADVDMIRSKILKRPKEISRVVNELFEVNERAVIYAPRYRVTYRNVKTNETKTTEFDGVTSERLQRKNRPTSGGNNSISLPPPPPETKQIADY
jgi:hypothetical protein